MHANSNSLDRSQPTASSVIEIALAARSASRAAAAYDASRPQASPTIDGPCATAKSTSVFASVNGYAQAEVVVGPAATTAKRR